MQDQNDMSWRTYRSGDVIFREGEPSDAAYLIISGEVRIVKGLESDTSKTIATVRAGEYVGEMGAIDDQPRSASAVAEGSVVCMPVTPDAFMDMLERPTDTWAATTVSSSVPQDRQGSSPRAIRYLLSRVRFSFGRSITENFCT